MILTIMLLCDYYYLPVLFFFSLKKILGYSRLISTQPPDFPAQPLGMYHTSTSGQPVKSELQMARLTVRPLQCIDSFINRSRLRIGLRSTNFMRIYTEPLKATLFDSLAGDLSTLAKQAAQLAVRPMGTLAMLGKEFYGSSLPSLLFPAWAYSVLDALLTGELATCWAGWSSVTLQTCKMENNPLGTQSWDGRAGNNEEKERFQALRHQMHLRAKGKKPS